MATLSPSTYLDECSTLNVPTRGLSLPTYNVYFMARPLKRRVGRALHVRLDELRLVNRLRRVPLVPPVPTDRKSHRQVSARPATVGLLNDFLPPQLDDLDVRQ